MSENQDNTRDNRAEYQQDTVMAHEYDGIQEFDNRLPNWWMWIMWGSIVFALCYWLVFHTLEIKPLPAREVRDGHAEGPGRAAGPGGWPPASTTTSW